MTKLEEIKQRYETNPMDRDYQTSPISKEENDLLALCEDYDRELREAREELDGLREQARMAGEWALLDPGEQTAMLSWEQRDHRDAAAYCASLARHKENDHE